MPLTLAFVLALLPADDVQYVAGKTASLKVNDTFTVKLQALPGAGYTWSPATEGRPNLKFTSVKTMPVSSGAIGGKQMMVFTFLATAAGAGNIDFRYGRPWEMKKGAKPEKNLAVPYSVK